MEGRQPWPALSAPPPFSPLAVLFSRAAAARPPPANDRQEVGAYLAKLALANVGRIPFWIWAPPIVWAASLGLLLLVGYALSNVTLARAERMPDGEGGHPPPGDAALRFVYRVVLALCCAYYYHYCRKSGHGARSARARAGQT